MEQWGLRGSLALPWVASVHFCRWDQEQSSGELVPFAFSLPFPVLLLVMSFFQSNCGNVIQKGLSVTLPVLASFMPDVRRKGSTLFCVP